MLPGVDFQISTFRLSVLKSKVFSNAPKLFRLNLSLNLVSMIEHECFVALAGFFLNLSNNSPYPMNKSTAEELVEAREWKPVELFQQQSGASGWFDVSIAEEACLVVVIAGITVAFLHRRRTDIQERLFARYGWKFVSESSEDVDSYLSGAFVSFGSHENLFVLNELLPRLDTERGYR